MNQEGYVLLQVHLIFICNLWVFFNEMLFEVKGHSLFCLQDFIRMFPDLLCTK